MIPEIKAQIVKGEQPQHDNPHHSGRIGNLRGLQEAETAEQWGLSYYFGVELTQEQIEEQFPSRRPGGL